MKCPNCHCEISSNERICRYCGFDIDAHRKEILRENQDAFYRNAMQYYEESYRQEKERNERYRQWTLVCLIAVLVLLNIMELILVLWK